MKLQEILERKGTDVHHSVPEETLENAIQKMVDCGCGSLVICDPADPEKLVGIMSERDVLRAIAAGKTDLANIKIQEIMTTNVHTLQGESRVDEAMGLMTNKRIRHLPIVEEGRLRGIISIGDVVKAQHDSLSMENHYLKNYLQG